MTLVRDADPEPDHVGALKVLLKITVSAGEIDGLTNNADRSVPVESSKYGSALVREVLLCGHAHRAGNLLQHLLQGHFVPISQEEVEGIDEFPGQVKITRPERSDSLQLVMGILDQSEYSAPSRARVSDERMNHCLSHLTSQRQHRNARMPVPPQGTGNLRVDVSPEVHARAHGQQVDGCQTRHFGPGPHGYRQDTRTRLWRQRQAQMPTPGLAITPAVAAGWTIRPAARSAQGPGGNRGVAPRPG